MEKKRKYARLLALQCIAFLLQGLSSPGMYMSSFGESSLEQGPTIYRLNSKSGLPLDF